VYLFFDTETTGLPKNWQAPISDVNNWPRLVQIAWLVYNQAEKRIISQNHIIKPEGFTIPREAEMVHGISTQKALKQGQPLQEVLENFARDVAEAELVIAHNINFDEKIAGAEFLRKQINNDFFQKTRVCTMQSSIDFCQLPGNYGYKWPKLSELHIKLFDCDFEDAHDALVDVEACARCFFELKKLGIINL